MKIEKNKNKSYIYGVLIRIYSGGAGYLSIQTNYGVPPIHR